MTIVERTLGAKQLRVIRDPATGHGTVQQPADPTTAARYSLTDATTCVSSRRSAGACRQISAGARSMSNGR